MRLRSFLIPIVFYDLEAKDLQIFLDRVLFDDLSNLTGPWKFYRLNGVVEGTISTPDDAEEGVIPEPPK